MRAATFSVLSAVLTGAVLVTACGAQPADSPAASVHGAVSASPDLPGGPDGLERDGVRITGMSDWPSEGTSSAEFEVTNRESEPFTYTITFDIVSGSGAVQGNTEQTVSAVGPGQTVKGTVRLSASTPALREGRGRVNISKVRRVPTAEAPAEAGPCPSSGVRLTADEGSAAMGLRVVGLRLTNCGTRVYDLNGFPLLQLLAEDRKPILDVKIFHGSGGIAVMDDFDAPARQLALQPGQTAHTGLMWRNTTGLDGAHVNAPYVRVRATRDAQPVMITPELDLGTTGKLAVSPWKKG